MGLRKKLVGGVVALSASALPLLLDARPAAAESRYASKSFTWTFTDSFGQKVECGVSGYSSLSRPDGAPAFEAQSQTAISGGCSGILAVEATYKNADGSPRRSRAFHFATSDDVNLFNDDVGSDYVATHEVSLENCASDCFVRFTTVPK